MDHSAVAPFIATCVVIFTIFGIIRDYWRQRHLYKQAYKFPGPPALPIIGNAHLLAGNSEESLKVTRELQKSHSTAQTYCNGTRTLIAAQVCSTNNIRAGIFGTVTFNKFIKLGKSYPSPFRLWLGNYLTFVISTPEQLRVVLQSPKTMNKGVFYDFVRPWLGTGLLSAPATTWKLHRKLMQPAFSPTILKSYVDIFAARSLTLALKMRHNLDGPEFDVYNYVSKFTLHSICETTMGVNLEARSQMIGDGSYAEAIDKVLAGICKRVVSPWLHPDFIFYRTLLGKEQKKYIEFLHKFTENVIETKQKELLEQSGRQANPAPNDDEIDGDGISQKKVFLDHLIESSSANSGILADEVLRDEVDTMIVAGSDTTAVTSCYLILMVASHPEVQEKIYQELCEIYGDDIGEQVDVTPEDLTRMSYMERVIKETMRLFHISPILSRSVVEDLQIGEHILPAGSIALLSIVNLHRNGDIWPDPLKFDPDRFLPEEVRKRDSFAYLPFSGGPRNCIGAKYAMMSMKTLLSTILRRYVLKKDHIVPVKDLRIKWEFLGRPADPITMRIERRKADIASV